MPDSITEAIEASIRATEDPEALSSPDVDSSSDSSTDVSSDVDTSDTSDDTSAEPDAVSPSSGAASKDAEPAKEPAKEPVADDKDDVSLYGVKEPKPGERENRLPYSRHKKIVDNAVKKLKDGHTVTLTETTKKLTAAEARNQQMDAVDRLIVADPDRYISELARIHPNLYGKFLKPAVVEPPAPVIAEKPPAPDAKFPDGSEGYSPEGLEKLREWDRAQAVKTALAETEKLYTKRFGPIEQQYKTQQVLNEKLPIVRAQIAEATRVWGDLFTKNENEITAYLKANPTVAFGQAVATVLVPKAQSSRDTMRADILKEINARPKAVSRTPATAVVATKDTPGAVRTMEQVIQDSITKAGLR